MYKRIIGVLLALVMALPVTPVMASHTNNYVTVPTEHDDQGRSLEPDGAITSVLANIALENKIYDPTYLTPAGAIPDSQLPPPTAGHSSVLAPGCTDDIGKQPSGLCALWSTGANPQNAGGNLCPGCPLIPAKTVGVTGMSGSSAPGRFSTDKGTIVRFLDNLQPLHITPPAGGVQYIELNRKLDDTGVRAALVGVAPEFATDYLILYQGMWAWYGGWQDKNGNGVIDELGPTCSGLTIDTCPPINPDDEFWWYGNCFRFPSGAGLQRSDLCVAETTQMLGWVYPGNHHTFSGGSVAGQGATSAVVPADFPFRQALCAADIVIGRKIVTLTDGLTGSPSPMACPGRFEDLENTGILTYGDSFLDDQTSVQPDFLFADRVGDPNIGTRQWVAGNGFSMPFYDQSLLQSTVAVAGVFSPGACLPSPCSIPNLANAQYIDVDKFNSVLPVVSDLLLTTVKPTARTQWIVVRDQMSALDNANDAIIGNAAISRDAVKGPVDNTFFDPGYAHEPNHAGDVFPGITRGVCASDAATQAGWCTDYSSYVTTRKAYADALGFRVGTTNFVVVILNNGSPVGVSCILCVAGGGIANPIGDGTPKPAGTPAYARSFAPGAHLFSATLGSWQDKPQYITDTLYDVTCLVNNAGCGGPSGLLRSTSYVVAPDSWVGSILNTTATYHYRGYSTDTCDIPAQGGSAVREFAICHPYRDGIINNPQSYGAGQSIGEWSGACVSASFLPPFTPLANQAVIDIIPLDASGNPGVWANPTFVDRDFFNQRPDVSNLAPWQSKLQDFTGSNLPIRMATSCGSTTAAGFQDLLIMPMGNLGQDVRTVFTGAPVVSGVRTVITDVDEYVGWAA